MQTFNTRHSWSFKKIHHINWPKLYFETVISLQFWKLGPQICSKVSVQVLIQNFNRFYRCSSDRITVVGFQKQPEALHTESTVTPNISSHLVNEVFVPQTDVRTQTSTQTWKETQKEAEPFILGQVVYVYSTFSSF